MPRIHTFRSKPTIQSKCSNSWRNNYCTSHWSSNRENSWHLWTWGCNSIITWFKDGPPVFWYPEERVGSWMNYTFPMPNSDPVRNYSLNIRKQKEANFAWHNRRLASRRLVRTPSALLPAKRPCSQRTNPATERKWKVIHSNSSHGGALSTAVSKMVTRLVRHYDQDERQPDAAIVWDAMKPVLLKAFAKQEARDFSDTEWLGLIHQGSSKTRFEYCEDSKNSLAYFRAIQGHSGGITVAPELMGHTLIPYNWKEYFFTGVVLPASNLSLRTDSFQVDRKAREGRQTLFFTLVNPFGRDSDEEEPRDDCTIPQKVRCYSHWKRNQDAVYWVKLSRAQDQGSQFWQTKSTAIIVHSPVPADCIYTVISENGDGILLESLLTPRPAPKEATGIRSSTTTTSSVFVMMCRPVQRNLYGILSQLLTTSHNSKSIFE